MPLPPCLVARAVAVQTCPDAAADFTDCLLPTPALGLLLIFAERSVAAAARRKTYFR
jgi:hypothetical protein